MSPREQEIARIEREEHKFLMDYRRGELKLHPCQYKDRLSSFRKAKAHVRSLPPYYWKNK
jgi:hypothetical protein